MRRPGAATGCRAGRWRSTARRSRCGWRPCRRGLRPASPARSAACRCAGPPTAPPPVGLEVGPPLYPGADDGVGWPATFARHPVDPGARAAAPWAWGLAGLMVGAAMVLWRGGAPAGAAGRGRSLEWLRAVGRVRGPDFWRAAAEAAAWLAE